MVTLLLAACALPPDEAPVVVVDEPLAPVDVLSRASIDLRGRRPSEAELLAVEADPAALAPLLDNFVYDAAFPERLISVYSEVFRTRADRYLVSLDNDVAFLDPAVNLAFRHSVGEEPLRIVAHVAANDLPFTDIVTADYTMANELMFEHLPLIPLEEVGERWRKAQYLDQRPAVGVLGTSGMWWRYTSTYENANRGRAEAIGRILLCDERFTAAVSFQGGSGDLEERISEDPACVSCHATLDPLGSYLWGFMWRNQEAWLEVTRYNAANELEWEDLTGVAPGLYGVPGEDLRDLGEQIAADPRFVTCAVETGMRALLNRRLTADDADALITHRTAFLDGGLTLTSLYRSLVDDTRYRGAYSDASGASPLRTMRPDQIAGAIEALTGFRWAWQGNDMLDTDEDGMRILAGGVDGVLATEPAPDPSTTTVLVQERVAEAAGQWAVAREAVLPAEERTLFREADPDAVPDDAALTAQLQALLLRCHGRRYAAEDADVAALAELWASLYATSGDPAVAWSMVLSAIFRHPDFVLY